ncbi:hypothetical protein DSECCO2_498760 [anaerobic digester metagenome]
MGHAQHGHAVAGQALHDVQDLVDHFRVQGRGGFVEEHDLGLHGQSSGDGHALLLAARQFDGVLVGLVADAHPVEQAQGRLLGFVLGDLLDLHGGQGDVLEHRQVGVEVELLEDDADLGAQGVQVLGFVRDVFAVDDDLAVVHVLEAVHAAHEGGFAGAAGPADDQHLSLLHGLVDVLQDVKVTEPFVDIAEFDHGHAWVLS